MNLRELHLSDLAVIPGAVDVSGGTSQKREQSFHVDEGWDLREMLPGVFSISRADMPHAVTVGGCGYSYVAMQSTAAERQQFEQAIGLLSASDASPDYDAMTDAECCAAGFHRRNGERCACGYKPGRKGKR